MGPETTSSTLLERVRDRRDDESWRAFFALYYPLITKYARLRGLRVAEAEEVAQDCMDYLAQRMPTFEYARRLGHFRAYLRKIADHRVADLRRRKQPRQATGTALAGVPAPSATDDTWDRLWTRAHLLHCLNAVATRCSKRTVEAFRLYALEDWPVAQVGATLGMSANQVYLAKARMLGRLKRAVTQLIGDVL